MKRIILLLIFLTTANSFVSAQWKTLANVHGWAQCVCFHKNLIIMGQPGGIFRSTDNGTTWLNSVSDSKGGFGSLAIVSDGTNIFAARGAGLVSRSTDNGVNWTGVNTGLPNSGASALYAYDNKVFVGLSTAGIFVSTNSGDSWSKSDSGVTNKNISVLSGKGDTIFAGTTDGNVFRSVNGGKIWTKVSPNSFSSSTTLGAIYIDESMVLIGNQTGSPGILRSTNLGDSWSSYAAGFPDIEDGLAWGFAKVDSFLFVGMGSGSPNGGLYRRTKNTSWVNVCSNQMIGAQPPFYPKTYYIPAWTLAAKNGVIFAAMSGFGLYRSTDHGNSWFQLTTDISKYNEERLAFEEHNGILYCEGQASGIFVSIDDGSNWKEYVTNLSNNITSLVFLNDTLFAGEDFNAGVRRSADGGHVWEIVNTGLTSHWVNKLAAGNNIIYAGTQGGVFSSTNMGDNWTKTSPGDFDITALFAKGNLVFASRLHEVYRSTNSGGLWTLISTNVPQNVFAFASIGSRLFMGGGGGATLSTSTDNGATWSNISGTITSPVRVLASAGDTLFASNDLGIFYSTNYQDWTAIPNDGLSFPIRFRTLLIRGGYIYGGMGDGSYSAFRRKIGPNTTSAEIIETKIPDKFILKQNYPNPFNPATTIEYIIPVESFVEVKVFDILGNEVSTLVSERQIPGSYKVTFDALNLPAGRKVLSSGIYIAQIKSGEFIKSFKMTLLK